MLRPHRKTTFTTQGSLDHGVNRELNLNILFVGHRDYLHLTDLSPNVLDQVDDKLTLFKGDSQKEFNSLYSLSDILKKSQLKA